MVNDKSGEMIWERLDDFGEVGDTWYGGGSAKKGTYPEAAEAYADGA